MTVVVGDVHDEREALLTFLAAQRDALRLAAYGLTDEQATATPTVSSLSIAGLVKHAGRCERGWLDRVTGEDGGPRDWDEEFVLVGDETLAGALAELDEVARLTEARVRALESLDVAFALPESAWFPPGSTRTARWVLNHLIAEQARHAGHADIIREAIDGRTSLDLVRLRAAAEEGPDEGADDGGPA